MANLMVQRRDLLTDFLKGILPGNFKFANRLRIETFKSDNRAERIRIMGDPTAYCEVLFVGNSVEQDDTGTRTVLDNDLFRVNLWLAFKDNDDYALSSQAEFDTIMLDDESGIITGLGEAGTINPSGYSPGVALDLAGIESTVVSLDESGQELAHFLTFTILIR